MRLRSHTQRAAPELLLRTSSAGVRKAPLARQNTFARVGALQAQKDKQQQKQRRRISTAADTDRGKGGKAEEEIPSPSSASSSPPTSLSCRWPGAHVSAQGGVGLVPERARNLGCRSFSFFTQNQRRFANKPLLDTDIQDFKQGMIQHAFSPTMVIPHGSYLVNLANPDPAKRQKSRSLFVDELRRTESLGLHLFNFHPGSTVGACSVDDGLRRVSEEINWAHGETAGSSVVCVLENTAGAGNTIGHRLEHLRDIIEGVVDKSRVGVCIDTAHTFAAGYDLRTPADVAHFWDQFDTIVGREFLRAMHLNDSKADFDSRRDLHANIGSGKIGLECFRAIMGDDRLRDVPLILETEGWCISVFRVVFFPHLPLSPFLFLSFSFLQCMSLFDLFFNRLTFSRPAKNKVPSTTRSNC
jgi:apurinic endonuclease APN1